MRIPLLIAIPLCIITLLGVWFAGTYNKDFTTPPSPDELELISKQWNEEQPEAKSSNTDADTNKDESNQPLINEEPEVIEEVILPLLPAGDLTRSPSLSEYGIFNDKGSAELIRLAEYLTEQEFPQRALLAWERVLDMTSPNDQQREQAILAISQLKKTLSPWGADPLAATELNLNVNTQVKDPAALKETILAIAAMINQSSDFIIKASVQLKNTPPQGDKAALVNVRFSKATGITNNSPSIALPYRSEKPDEFKKTLHFLYLPASPAAA